MAADLSHYFERIGYGGSARADRSTLETLCELHPRSIPFENIDPLLRRPVDLDLPAIEAKLVRGGRGGYCFEHNLLFADILRSIGFEVTPLAARVVWRSPDPSRVGPRSHMLLRVELEGAPHVVDVGFGGLTLTGVLRLEPDVEQTTPHEPFRLRLDGDTYGVEAKLHGQWAPLYRFDLQRQETIDYVVSSWFLCTNEMSPFVRVLMGARTFEGGRHALRDNVWTKYETGRDPQQQVLDQPEKLAAVLTETFGVALPPGADTDHLMAELVSRPDRPSGPPG